MDYLNNIFSKPITITTDKELQYNIDNDRINISILLTGSFISEIKNIRKVDGSLIIQDSTISSLGSIEEIVGDLKIISNNVYSSLLSLQNITKIHGSLYLENSNLSYLGKVEHVGGDLDIKKSRVRSLGDVKYVGGNVELGNDRITSIGNLEFVGGNIDFRNTLIKDLDHKIKVKGKVILPFRLKSNGFEEKIEDYEKIIYRKEIKSSDIDFPALSFNNINKKSIPFWDVKYVYNLNDINKCNDEQRNFFDEFKECFYKEDYIDLEGNWNYVFLLYYEIINQYNSDQDLQSFEKRLNMLGLKYPITLNYVQNHLIDLYLSSQAYNPEKSWKYYTELHENTKQGFGFDISKIWMYELLLKRDLLTDFSVVNKTFSKSGLTNFGKDNIQLISLYYNKVYYNFLNEIKAKTMDSEITLLKYIILYINKNDVYEGAIINYENYLPLIKRKSLLNYYYHIDVDLNKTIKYNKYRIPYLVQFVIREHIKLFYREAEDLYRKENDLPEIGGGWISETELYIKIKKDFPDFIVIQHASPEWLGLQHLDVYFKDLNIALEYQGKQHYEPVDYFGGKKAFEDTVKRDKIKANKCKANNCDLIIVNENYNYNDLKENLEILIHKKLEFNNRELSNKSFTC